MKEDMNTSFYNKELLTKYLCNEVNDLEKSEVETWLKLSVNNLEELEKTRKMLDSVDTVYQAKKYNSYAAWSTIKSKIDIPQPSFQKSAKKVFTQFYKYAAILIVAILLGSAAYYFGFKNNTVQYSEIVAIDKQVINEFILPDGSKVALNSNSKLIFPEEFKGNFREVTIEGEAFFDVKPNKEQPFVINAGNAQVKVLGTSFNVRAYPEAEKVEVVVATGKVQVISKYAEEISGSNEVFLIPGEKGTMINSSRIIEKSENSNPNYLAWKTRDFIFEDVPLSDVFTCLENTYHVNINVLEPELRDLKLNAQFDEKSIDFILNVVGLTFDLDLSVDKEQYTFSSHKNN